MDKTTTKTGCECGAASPSDFHHKVDALGYALCTCACHETTAIGSVRGYCIIRANDGAMLWETDDAAQFKRMYAQIRAEHPEERLFVERSVWGGRGSKGWQLQRASDCGLYPKTWKNIG